MSGQKTVFGADDANGPIILEFTPKEFIVGRNSAAEDAYNMQQAGSHFRLSEQASIKAGIDEMQKKSFEKKVEEMVLERLQQIEQPAYKEAYALGLDEGRDRAQKQASVDFQERLEHLDVFLKSLESLRADILKQNEASLIKLVYHVAKRMAYQEIQQKPETILQVLNEVVGPLQEEDRTVVWVSQEDMDFLLTQQKTFAKELFAKAKFEVHPGMTAGGCHVETLHGTTDASLEERVQRVWESLQGKIPKPDGEVG